MIPLYILDDAAGERWRLGGASRWWLHASLAALQESLRMRGSRLILRRGDSLSELLRIAGQCDAGAVYLTRRYEPWAVKREAEAFRLLGRAGLQCRRFTGGLLFEPEDIANRAGEPYKVFTAFARACRAAPPPDDAPLAAPDALRPPPDDVASESLEDWDLQPTKPDWAGGLRECWGPGESAARERLARFAETALGTYADNRDRPDRAGTSRLSPHLHFGEISPRACWRTAQAALAQGGKAARGAQAFAGELLWREFSHHLLFHVPSLPDSPFRPEFTSFPWRRDSRALAAWRAGLTGYPIVDAGMRELWETGWMHNRVRMVAASFLVKHLLIHWQDGEDWFWDTLVDADLANNAANWQWVAGSGADAAPYFRIFNPVLQGKKFDPKGDYVRRWVPELKRMPESHIHAPWTAPDPVLRKAGVVAGETYPNPMVDHKQARQRALQALREIKSEAV